MSWMGSRAGPALDKKQTIIILQWLIIIVSSYLVLFSKGGLSADLRAQILVVLYLASALALYRLPERIYHHSYFDKALLVSDTLLICTAIYLNQDAPWDLFLLYFFILFLAGVGDNMGRIVLGSILVSAVYVGILVQQGKSLAAIGPEVFLRIPFLFGASILYGYLSENARQEKSRAETAVEKERLKMELVSALAHDIKSPLGVIVGYTEVMMEQLSDEKNKLDILERIRENSQRIVNLVTGFLEASKAEAGKLEISYRPIAINSLLKRIARQEEADCMKKKLTLEMELDPHLPEILGDEAQLDRVFWNLIGNAIKFTPAGGKIRIISKRYDGHASVTVQDTGIGIPAEELPLLFSQFRRLKGSTKIEGTGLGLFIVKTIIEAHKGTVHAESEDGKGTSFIVRIPLHS